MSAYCRNNPINNADPTGEHAKNLTCGDPTCTVCNKSRRDFINKHLDWYNKVTGSNVLKVLDDGTFVYMVSVSKSNTNYSDNAIFIQDQRTNSDPNIKIVDSVAISEHNQLMILELIQDYNDKNPVQNKEGIS